jgi:hypothetical protein
VRLLFAFISEKQQGQVPGTGGLVLSISQSLQLLRAFIFIFPHFAVNKISLVIV